MLIAVPTFSIVQLLNRTSSTTATAATAQRTNRRLDLRAQPVFRRTRPHIIVQTIDRQHGRIEVQGRFNIRSEKSARLNRVLIDKHVDVKSLLNIADRPFDIQQSAVRVGSSDNQLVGLREINHLLVVFTAGAKRGGELIRRQIVAKVGITRLIKRLKQVRELFAVAQRQTDGQVQTRATIKPVDGGEPFSCRGHMAFENLLRRRGWQRGNHPARHYQRQCGETTAWKFAQLPISGGA